MKEHLASVASSANEFAGEVSWKGEAVLAGFLHDIGKYADLFQARLRGEESGLDHSSLGACPFGVVMALDSDPEFNGGAGLSGQPQCHIGHNLIASDIRPKPVFGPKCESCPLYELCLPKVTSTAKSVTKYLSNND